MSGLKNKRGLTMGNPKDYINCAKEAIKLEIKGMESILQKSLDETFVKVIDTILNTKGRVIVSGMGKPGHIGKKFAASLASTGTPAFFVHPAETSHGDMGMVTKDDTLFLLSDSGGTKELKDLIWHAKRYSITLIGLTRVADSTLAQAADIKVVLERVPETNPVNSPTTSMLMFLAYCHAVITTLIQEKSFNNDNYKVLHPGGKLGSALIKVEDIMWIGDKIPIANEDTPIKEVISIMSQKHLGCTGVVDKKKNLVGIITDGDLRRHIEPNLLSKTAKDIMTKNPVVIDKNKFATEAVKLMNSKGIDNKGISAVFVIDEKEKTDNVIGILHINEIIRAGVI
jgi:arabinose-5-phosphate isomerase